jgi:hypothetical protein
MTDWHYYTGPGHGPFNGLTDDGKIAVASTLITFVVVSITFFIIGFLCGHFCRKERHNTQTSTGPGTVSQCDQENISSTQAPYYDDVVLKQHEQELELKINVAYVPVATMKWCVYMYTMSCASTQQSHVKLCVPVV